MSDSTEEYLLYGLSAFPIGSLFEVLKSIHPWVFPKLNKVLWASGTTQVADDFALY